MPTALEFLQSQIYVKVPLPSKKFTGQIVIVTGSNTGLGLEAARHLVRLDAAKVILAVRNLSSGNDAAASIEKSTGRKGVVEVWELDLASYSNVKQFSKRANGLSRLDVLICNAGVAMFDYIRAEQDDMNVTVNVVSTFLLGILLLPKLKDTSVKLEKETVLTFTGSLGHSAAEFPERKSERIFNDLAREEGARMMDRYNAISLPTYPFVHQTDVILTIRYNVTKLISLLLARELANTVTEKRGEVIVSTLNPGLVDTQILKHAGYWRGILLRLIFKGIARTPEEGSRTLVLAAEGGRETHGQYLDDGKVGRQVDRPSSYRAPPGSFLLYL
ncbi:hypothetical protein EsH8_X_000551 [Colletotrichum jinshuiense]